MADGTSMAAAAADAVSSATKIDALRRFLQVAEKQRDEQAHANMLAYAQLAEMTEVTEAARAEIVRLQAREADLVDQLAAREARIGELSKLIAEKDQRTEALEVG